jgi:hypothetical protein
MKRMAMILMTTVFVVPFAQGGEPKQDKSSTGVIVMTEVTAADLPAKELCGAPNRVYAVESSKSPNCVSAHPYREVGLLDKCDGRIWNWLTYRPPSKGPACCKAPQACYPPLYTFFLDHCSGGHCQGACAAHPVNQTAAPPLVKPAPEPIAAPRN